MAHFKLIVLINSLLHVTTFSNEKNDKKEDLAGFELSIELSNVKPESELKPKFLELGMLSADRKLARIWLS